MATNDIRFRVKNGLAVGASGFGVINDQGEWIGNSGLNESPYGATGAQGTYGASGITGDAGIDGASGATGIEGTQGATGIEGYQGATGSQGTQGDVGSVGTDGASGADGYQGATGSQGSQGDDGTQGTNGASGVDGVQGSTGVVGIDGASGVQGVDGWQGLDGATGATGVAGIDGASGPTGEIGATGVSGARYHTTSSTNLDFGSYFTTSIEVVDDNLNYSAGQTIIITDLAHAGQHFHATVNTWIPSIKDLNFTVNDYVGTISSTSWEINLSAAEGQLGASGATGITGDQGLDGASGSQGSSFGTQGATGADGDAGIDGASGAQGHQGATGATGVRGTVGHTGATGILGDDGVQGATGVKGSTGAFGEDGEQGITGADGYQGATGSIGTQGDDGDQGYTGIDGATGLTGATGAQGGNGSYSIGEVSYERSATWSSVFWVDNSLTTNGHRIEYFDVTEPIGALLNALNIGDTVTLRWNYSYGGGWTDQVLTVTEAWNAGNGTGLFSTGYIKVNAGPVAYNTVSMLFSDTVGDVILINSGSGPTNTGISGSTGATGAQGAVGNAGFDADQLTTGNPRGLWDIGTYYYVDDIVVTIAPSPDSHRCIVPNIGNDPDTTSGYWVTTAYAGASGASGIDGASGVTGQVGATGAPGYDQLYPGTTGDAGQQGINGASGVNGSTGVFGATGITGDLGIDGASGADGYQGASGATGAGGLRFKSTVNDGFQVQDTGTGDIQLDPDTQTGDYTFGYSAGQRVVIAKDYENYCVALVNSYDNSTGVMNITTENNYGTSTGILYINLDGAVGWIGASGATGISGASGVTGDIGTTGDAGLDGYQGSTGAQGIDGASGATGITGATGAQGIDGASGPQGIDGDVGIDGASGPQGATGQIGHDGATGYSLATGSTGLSGMSQQTVDIFASNIVGTAKYLVQGVDGSTNVQATEVILTQNASGVYITEYATLKTGSKVMDVTAASSGGVVSLKVTPTSSPTNVSWVRESVQGRIGGTTVDDDGSNVFSSRSHSDFLAIPIGKAYVYPTQYFIDLIDFSTLASTHASITVDSAGVGPQNPAVGTVDTWDGATLVLTITSGNFTSRDDLDKITYGY